MTFLACIPCSASPPTWHLDGHPDVPRLPAIDDAPDLMMLASADMPAGRIASNPAVRLSLLASAMPLDQAKHAINLSILASPAPLQQAANLVNLSLLASPCANGQCNQPSAEPSHPTPCPMACAESCAAQGGCSEGSCSPCSQGTRAKAETFYRHEVHYIEETQPVKVKGQGILKAIFGKKKCGIGGCR